MNFREFVALSEAKNVGLAPATRGQIAAQAGMGALKVAADAIPMVGAVTTLGDTIRQVIGMIRSGKNAKNLISKLMQTKDANPGIPANAFDIEDEFASRLSPKALEEIAGEVQTNIEKILQDNKNPNKNFANRVAHNYMMRYLTQLRKQI